MIENTVAGGGRSIGNCGQSCLGMVPGRHPRFKLNLDVPLCVPVGVVIV